MKNKTAFALTAAMILSFCTNSQAGALADLIYARIDTMIASGGTPTSFSSSDMDAFRKSYNASSSSSLVTKSQVSSTSSSSSSLSNLLDQRLAAATLQAQAANAKATAVNFSSGEYIPTRNVDGYSVTASGVKATPTVKPSAAAPSATLVNKVKIQSASAQQAQNAVAQLQARSTSSHAKFTVTSPVLKGVSGNGNSIIQQSDAKLAAINAQYQQTLAAAKAKATSGNSIIQQSDAKLAAVNAQYQQTLAAAKAKVATAKTPTVNASNSSSLLASADAQYHMIMSNLKANGLYVTKQVAMTKANTQTKAIHDNLSPAAKRMSALSYAALNGLKLANSMSYDHGVPTPGMDWGIPYHYQSTQKFRSLDVNYVSLAQAARHIQSMARR